MQDEQALIEIIKTCDGKVNSHNRIIIAETFGLFSVLGLIRGKLLLFFMVQTIFYPAFLVFAYIALLLLILYSFSRSIHYTKMINLALERISDITLSQALPQGHEKQKVDTIVSLNSEIYDTACEKCRWPINVVAKWRRKRQDFVIWIAFTALLLSLALLFVVLFSP